MQKSKIVSIGLAIFTMLFGAGNVIFPLILGREAGTSVFYAIGGFFLTAVAVPLLGLVSVMLFEGDYHLFLKNMGRIPAMLVAFICMILIGPFGATPRCVALSHSVLSWHLPNLSLFVYSIIAAIIIFFLTMKKNAVVTIFGRILGPLKLILLFSIIIIGLLNPLPLESTGISPWQGFINGLKEGYLTMDLLATIFFSGLIYGGLKQLSGNTAHNHKKLALAGLKAGIIGGGLLGAVYLGFCLIAAMYGPHVASIAPDKILSALASIILGSKAGILANITVAVACLTTAIALTAVVADYVSHELFKGKINYLHALLLTVVATFAMTNLGFAGIMKVIAPLVELCYPALITLAIANLLQKLFGFAYTQIITLVVFVLTCAIQYGSFFTLCAK